MGRISAATAEVGERLRSQGYPLAPQAQVARQLFDAGDPVPTTDARAALPGGAWGARLVRDEDGHTHATGRILTHGSTLLWADTRARARAPYGVPSPDAIDAELCTALPSRPVRRHLDIGGGIGAVALFAASTARQVTALEPRERCTLALHRSISLSGQAHITAEGLQPVDAATTGLADRVTARLEQGDLALLPHVLHLDGVALVHVHGGDGGAVAETLHAAFATRPWAGRWRATGPTGGLLLLLADGDPGWGPIPDGIRLGPDTTVALLGG